MTNWETKTATGTVETKAQSIQCSIHSAVEQISANINLINSLKKLTDELMDISILHSESIKSLLIKLAEELENNEATSTARMRKGE